MLYSLIKPLLFCLEPETAHAVALKALAWLERKRCYAWRVPTIAARPVQVMGLTFPNPVGLAAGLDKNGDYIDALAALGFGFIEVGTVTPRPQPGNPKPRLFRLPQAEAIINRMGFNNKGVDYLLEQLKKTRYQGILGINIGKNFDTPIEKAVDDYLICFNKVYNHASYITINISSPNTQNLRQLQQKDSLHALLSILKAQQTKLTKQYKKYIPLVVKIAPDLTEIELTQIAEVVLEVGIDGIIATNTTLDRTAVADLPHAKQAGGLSGKPLLQSSTQVVAKLHALLKHKIPIIGVGGIFSQLDMGQKMAAGAALIQVYTGFIYRGPDLIRELIKNS